MCFALLLTSKLTPQASLLHHVLMRNPEASPQLAGELVVALLTDRLLVVLVKLRLLIQDVIANGAGEVMDAPGLVECRKHIPAGDLIAHEAQVPKQLMVVRLTVSQTSLFVVPMPQEGLLTLGADKVLHVPVFTHGGDYTLLNRSSTRATNWNTHAIVAFEAVQLVHVVGCKSGAVLDLSRR